MSYIGVLHRHHLNRGVAKGAFSQEEADKKFDAWMKEKTAKVDGKVDGLAKATAEIEKARLDAEKAVNAKKAAEVAAKNAPLAEEVEATTEEAPATEAPAEEAAPVATEEVKEEAPAAEATEEAKEEEK